MHAYRHPTYLYKDIIMHAYIYIYKHTIYKTRPAYTPHLHTERDKDKETDRQRQANIEGDREG